MKKSYLKYILFVYVIMFISVMVPKALSVTVSDDLVFASEGSSAMFNINNSSDYNSAPRFKDPLYGGYESGTSAQVSLKNGTYYVWSYTTSGKKFTQMVPVTNSCKNESKTKQTGSFTVQRCYYVLRGSNQATPDMAGEIASCADGYELDATKASVTDNTCNGIQLGNLSKRYCRVTYSFTCVKKTSGGGSTTTPAAKLASLSVSGGSLSPAFNAKTTSYTVNVGPTVSSVQITAKAASGGTIVSGYGSRTIKLGYGSNKAYVKVKNSSGKVTTYTIIIKRQDNRSAVNTLSNLTVDQGTLSPAFSSSVFSYSVDVPNETTSIKFDATLTDSNSKFVDGFGPRTEKLEEGVNQFQIKVKSQKGSTKAYSITVNRGSIPTECLNNDGSMALLKGIDLSVESSLIQIDQIQNFDPKNPNYENILVPYKVTNLTVTPLTMDEGDTFVVEGAEDLEVNVPKMITITVTSKKCPTIKSQYTLNVTRQPEVVPGSNPELLSLKVEGHEFEFEPNIDTYSIILKKDESSLNITYEVAEEGTTCNISGNEELKEGSEVVVTCIAEDESSKAVYKLVVDRVEKGVNVFLIIILVIIIIIVLIYLIMRLLGYKIYFNTAAIGAFFRGLGEKKNN